jgi:hypothetical protein
MHGIETAAAGYVACLYGPRASNEILDPRPESLESWQTQ